MRRILLIICLMLVPVFATAQPRLAGLPEILNAFKAFEYDTVIARAQQLLNSANDLSPAEKIELYRMKGTAHFVLDQQDSAAASFTEILKIDPEFTLDMAQNSPKIIAFFRKVKSSFAAENLKEKTQQIQPQQLESALIKPQSFQGALLRSMALPGWGHFYNAQKTKGVWFGSAALTSLLPAVYFVYRTARLERDYLNETDKTKINSRYDDFNQSYQLRNGMLAVYAALWLYAQIDLTSSFSENPQQKIQTVITPIDSEQGSVVFQINYRF